MIHDHAEAHAGDGTHRPPAQHLDVRVPAADEHELLARSARGFHAPSLTCSATNRARSVGSISMPGTRAMTWFAEKIVR